VPATSTKLALLACPSDWSYLGLSIEPNITITTKSKNSHGLQPHPLGTSMPTNLAGGSTSRTWTTGGFVVTRCGSWLVGGKMFGGRTALWLPWLVFAAPVGIRNARPMDVCDPPSLAGLLVLVFAEGCRYHGLRCIATAL